MAFSYCCWCINWQNTIFLTFCYSLSLIDSSGMQLNSHLHSYHPIYLLFILALMPPSTFVARSHWQAGACSPEIKEEVSEASRCHNPPKKVQGTYFSLYVCEFDCILSSAIARLGNNLKGFFIDFKLNHHTMTIWPFHCILRPIDVG